MKHTLALALLAPVAVLAQSAAAPKPAIDRQILHVQVILDKLGFSPGVLDGKGGMSLDDAVKGRRCRGRTPFPSPRIRSSRAS